LVATNIHAIGPVIAVYSIEVTAEPRATLVSIVRNYIVVNVEFVAAVYKYPHKMAITIRLCITIGYYIIVNINLSLRKPRWQTIGNGIGITVAGKGDVVVVYFRPIGLAHLYIDG
jgi:hypothetical protein